jgi:hypothetical protein
LARKCEVLHSTGAGFRSSAQDPSAKLLFSCGIGPLLTYNKKSRLRSMRDSEADMLGVESGQQTAWETPKECNITSRTDEIVFAIVRSMSNPDGILPRVCKDVVHVNYIKIGQSLCLPLGVARVRVAYLVE